MPMADELRNLPVAQLQPGAYQARRSFKKEEISDLAESIRQQGIIQPLTVRVVAEDKFEILAGERRWRAAQLIGLAIVPCVVKTGVSDKDAAAIGLIENIQREDVPPMELARGLGRLVNDFGMTHEQVAENLGKSRPQVTNTLRLLDSPKEIQNLVNEGKLPPSSATLLLSLPAPMQRELARRAVEKDWNRARLQSEIDTLRAGPKAGAEADTRHPDVDVRLLERELSEGLGAVARVEERSQGRGTLSISYDSLDHLDGIIEVFRTGAEKRRNGSK